MDLYTAQRHNARTRRAAKVMLVLIPALCLILIPYLVSLAGVNEWVTNGPEGAIVNSLALSPNFAADKTVFAATNGDGVYSSTDGGQNWGRIGLAGVYVLSLGISPSSTALRRCGALRQLIPINSELYRAKAPGSVAAIILFIRTGLPSMGPLWSKK